MSTSQEADVQRKKKLRAYAKGRFHRIKRRFTESNHENEQVSVLTELCRDLEKSYSELEIQNSKYMLHLDDEKDQVKIQELHDDMESIYGELYEVKSELSRKTKNAKAQEDSKEKFKSPLQSGLKVKKLDSPQFSGIIRDYPSFKRDYDRHMIPSFGLDPFALKKCLSGEALSTVKGVDDDFNEMFRRLDLKYGRPEKLSDAVLQELKGLTALRDGDNQGFIKMVDVIENCWLDLRKAGLKSEMNTSTMVSQIEKLLPSVQKREWVIMKQQLKSSEYREIFKTFLEFLLREKMALEYMENEFRKEGNTTRGRVHLASGDGSSTEAQTDQITDKLDLVLNQVVEGLAQVAEVMGTKKDGNESMWRGGNSARRWKCWYHNVDTHEIGKCTGFANLDLNEKMDQLRRNGGCFSCLKQGHLSSRCHDRKKCEVQGCDKMHHSVLHDQKKSGIVSHHDALRIVNDDHVNRTNRTLLMLSEVSTSSGSLTTLWDPGANMSLITHSAANRLGLTGKEVTLSLTKVGNSCKTVPSKEYLIPLCDREGQEWNIRAYGIEEVTASVDYVDVRQVASLFSGITEGDIKRPTGKVDLLVGTDCCILLPEKVQEFGGLQLMKNQFGYCLRGKHELLDNQSSDGCNLIQIHFTSGILFNNVNDDILISDRPSVKSDLETFFAIESLGTECTPKCGGCRCGKCPVGGKTYTIKEERELSLIQEGLKLDKQAKCWVVTYPWIRNPYELPNNYFAAKARLQSTERRLLRKGDEYVKLYDMQIQDMINRDVALKLNDCDLDRYKGPIYYLPHHKVLKPDSKSIPLRIVFNSSAIFMGHNLNEYWAKGPNMLNDLLSVLLPFRQDKIAVAGDISKMYNTVQISQMDQHTHRFLWRNMDASRDPDHYVLRTVTFGDRPSGAIATMALRNTAKLLEEEYPEACGVILENSYVDDILFSVSSSQVAERIAEEIDLVLGEGGFRVKNWTFSKGHQVVSQVIQSEKILGMIWEPHSDMFEFKAKLNFSPKEKKIHQGEDLHSHEVPTKIPEMLTRRMILSQVSSIFDPLGLISPFVLRSKLLLRSLCMIGSTDDKKEGWDVPIDEHSRQEWIQFFHDLFLVEALEFPRCIKPEGAYGKPILVIFSDGSKYAYGACAYVRWRMEDGSFQSCLVAAKNRIAPTRQLSIPRLELCGALLGARLRERLVRDLSYEFEEVYHIVDSMIVRAQIQKESYGFGTFTATRVAEIQNKTNKEEWWWIAGECNPADLTTRGTHPGDLKEGSIWQRGPDFMTKPIIDWPINKVCNISQLPDTVIGVVHNTTVDHEAFSRKFDDIDLNRFNNMDKLLRVTSIILKIAKKKSFRVEGKNFSVQELEEAEFEWVKYVQQDLGTEWRKSFKNLGVDINKDGAIVVGSRMAEWLKETWNRTEFILLPSKSSFTQICLTTLHNNDHGGIDSTLAKLRSKYWIPGAHKLLKGIRSKCVVCRKRQKVKQTQCMGRLPLDRLKPSPAFFYSAVDLFGPFTIRDTVKKRTHGKAFGVIFTCLTTRGVYLDLADSYSTDSFLMVLRRFVSIHGYPRKLRSDVGTQLVSASKELKEMNKNWDWKRIEAHGVHSGMDWEFNKSADAPWENGCCEALIKTAKSCLRAAVGDAVMSFPELQTVLFEAANCMNERPIGMKNGDPNEGTYLCPNDLLLGRASSKVPPGTWSDKDCFKSRWKFVQRIVDAFWKKWMRDFFPSLIVRQKWHVTTRNMQIGDVVLVQDSNAIRGLWKLAQVTKVFPSKDNVVRDVELRYKVQEDGPDYRGQTDTNIHRSVHRLVVILPIEEQI